MYELQTLGNFIKNPLGKGTSVLPNRDVIVDDFKRRKKIMEGNGKEFKVTVYKNDVSGTYLFHVLVPSETKRNNNYDVVFEFLPPESKGVFNKVSLDKYLVRFFSNSPSFVFTYANIMYNNNMGVDFLRKKYDKEILNKPPEIRNPTGTILYEKSIMFAALEILEDSKYFSDDFINKSKRNAQNALFAIVRTHEKILEQIKDEEARLSREKREDKKREKDEQKERSKQVRKLYGSNTSTRRIDAKKSTSGTTPNKTIRKTTGKKTTRKK